jgi:hypothetical protein
MNSARGQSSPEPQRNYATDRVFITTGAIGGAMGALLMAFLIFFRFFGPDPALLLCGLPGGVSGALGSWFLVPFVLNRFRRHQAGPAMIVTVGLLIGACIGALIPALMSRIIPYGLLFPMATQPELLQAGSLLEGRAVL